MAKRKAKFYIINDKNSNLNEEIIQTRCEHLGLKYAGLIDTAEVNTMDYSAYDRLGLRLILNKYNENHPHHSKDQAFIYFILAIFPLTSFLGLHAFLYKRKLLGNIHLGILAFMVLLILLSMGKVGFDGLGYFLLLLLAATISYAMSVISGVIELLSASVKTEKDTENTVEKRTNPFRVTFGIITTIITIYLYTYWYKETISNGEIYSFNGNIALMVIFGVSALGIYLSSYGKYNPLIFVNLALFFLSIVLLVSAFVAMA